VSSDGFVSSHVYCVVSSVTGYSQGYPTISQRQAETAATVRDGDSFVIGGLIQDEDLKSRSKVPLLGDIPLIGQAFRTDKQTRSKTELYIIVTPHIVHRVGTPVQAAAVQQTYQAPPLSIPPAPPPARYRNVRRPTWRERRSPCRSRRGTLLPSWAPQRCSPGRCRSPWHGACPPAQQFRRPRRRFRTQRP